MGLDIVLPIRIAFNSIYESINLSWRKLPSLQSVARVISLKRLIASL